MLNELDEETIDDILNEPEPSLNPSNRTIVYLDQNKWGDLHQARHSAASAYSDAYDTIRASVNNGNALYPFSLTRMVETDEHRDIEFRRQLYELMIDLSRNFCLQNFFEATKAERLAYIRRSVGLPEQDVREEIIDRGLVTPLGQPRIESDDGVYPDEPNKILQKLIRSEKFTRILIEDDEFLIEQSELQQESDEPALERRETLRQQSKELADNDEDRWKILLYESCVDHHLPLLYRLAQQNGIGIGSYVMNDITSQDTLDEFLSQFPTYYCQTVLCHGRDFHWDRKIEANDLKDCMSLAVAIPYADIVVTEQFFAGVAHKYGLPDRYNTTVITDLNQLPKYL